MTATKTSDQSQGAVESAKETGQEVVTQVQSQAQVKARELREGDRIPDAETRSTIVRLKPGSRSRRSAAHADGRTEQLLTDGQGSPARAVEQLAQKTESFGSYLTAADGDKILGDVEAFARRRPWLTAAAGDMQGLMAARCLKASSNRSFESVGSEAYSGGVRWRLEPREIDW